MVGKLRFEPLAKIASGASATVYVGAAADDPGALVALKRPHPHVLEDERQRVTLLREASVAAALHHPNVVQVREVEVQGSELQLVMDYVEGAAFGTLVASEAEKGARIPPAIAIRIVLDAAAGLQALHDQRDPEGRVLGLVHRDVSPQNILVGIDGVSRLTDFGLAKAVYQGAPSTTQGTLKGKLGYMAPEYVKLGQVDAGVDVFGLGVVLWEALAGRRLFHGENEAQTLDSIMHAEAPRVSAEVPALGGLDAVVAGALAKDPRKRAASAGELAKDLEQAARATGLSATHEEVGAYVQRAARAELEARRASVASALAARRRRSLRWPAVGIAAAATAVAAVAFVALGPGHAPKPVITAEPEPPLPVLLPPADAAASAPPPPVTATALSAPTASATTAAPATTPRARPQPLPAVPPNPYAHRPPAR